MISVRDEDRNFLRFIWIENGNVQKFGHCRVVFGFTSSLETKVRSIGIQLLKNAIYLYTKLCYAPKKSLLYSCLSMLVANVNSEKMKNNWYRDVLSELGEYNASHLLKNMDEMKTLPSISDLELSFKNCNMNNMNNSNRLPFYKFCYDDDATEKLYEIETWSLVKLAFQIKCNLGKYNTRKKTLKLLSYNSSFNDKEITCKFCHLYDEDLFHVLYKCPKYSELRIKFIGSLPTPDGRHLQLNILKNINVNMLNQIDLFLAEVCNIRDSCS